MSVVAEFGPLNPKQSSGPCCLCDVPLSIDAVFNHTWRCAYGACPARAHVGCMCNHITTQLGAGNSTRVICPKCDKMITPEEVQKITCMQLNQQEAKIGELRTEIVNLKRAREADRASFEQETKDNFVRFHVARATDTARHETERKQWILEKVGLFAEIDALKRANAEKDRRILELEAEVAALKEVNAHLMDRIEKQAEEIAGLKEGAKEMRAKNSVRDAEFEQMQKQIAELFART